MIIDFLLFLFALGDGVWEKDSELWFIVGFSRGIGTISVAIVKVLG